MNIWQAAVKVLQDAVRPLTLDEIHRRIVDAGLFQFGAKDPKGVLRRQIHRRCTMGHDCSSAREECFERLADKTYRWHPK